MPVERNSYILSELPLPIPLTLFFPLFPNDFAFSFVISNAVQRLSKKKHQHSARKFSHYLSTTQLTQILDSCHNFIVATTFIEVQLKVLVRGVSVFDLQSSEITTNLH